MKIGILIICFLTSILVFAAEDYQWVVVKKIKGSSGIHVTGKIVPQEGGRVIESARIQGRITQIIKREGQKVWMGSPLFSVSSADCISLEEELRVAKNQGLKDMIELTTKRERQLGLKLDDGECKVVATHPGILVKRNLDLGQTFNVGDPLATIIDITKLTVEMDVPENDLAVLKTGQSVSFQLAKKGSQKFLAPIEQIVPAIDQATRTIKIRLSPKKMPEGSNVDALVFGDIQTDSSSQILSIPTTALVFNHNKQYVIKKKGGEFTPIPVRVISEDESQSSVMSEREGELIDGDFVATKGTLFLFNQIIPET